MNNIKITLVIFLAFLQSCTSLQVSNREPSSAVFAPKYLIERNLLGDPVVTKQSGSPNYVDPVLADDVTDPDVLLKLRQQLLELSSIQLDTVKEAKLVIPDYEVAGKLLRALVRTNTVLYFDKLENIKIEIKRTFSELMALKKEADQYPDPNNLFQKAYVRDVKSKIPDLYSRINIIYSEAIQNLSSLGGNANIPINELKFSNSGLADNAFKIKTVFDLSHGLIGICETSLCVTKLAAELEQWQKFVSNFNKEVSFTDFNGKKALWNSEPVNTTPFATLGMLDAANDIIKFGLEKNKNYSIVSALAKYTANAIRTPVGIGVALLATPVFVFEKLGKAAETFLALRLMKVDLSLKKQEAYSDKDIIKGLRFNFEKYANEMNKSAIYIHEGEEKNDIIAPVYTKALEKAIQSNSYILNYYTDSELINLDNNKIYLLTRSVKFLSRERLLVLSENTNLNEVQKTIVKNAIALDDEIRKYDDNIIKKYGITNLKKYGLDALMKYRLDDLEKYGLEYLKKGIPGCPNVNTYTNEGGPIYNINITRDSLCRLVSIDTTGIKNWNAEDRYIIKIGVDLTEISSNNFKWISKDKRNFDITINENDKTWTLFHNK